LSRSSYRLFHTEFVINCDRGFEVFFEQNHLLVTLLPLLIDYVCCSLVVAVVVVVLVIVVVVVAVGSNSSSSSSGSDSGSGSSSR